MLFLENQIIMYRSILLQMQKNDQLASEKLKNSDKMQHAIDLDFEQTLWKIVNLIDFSTQN